MIKNITLLLIFVLNLSSLLGQNKDEKLVRKCYENYKSAILNDKGEKVIQFVDSRTIAYYTDILSKIKNADSIEVCNLSLMDRFLVFFIRHQATKSEILSFDGKGLLEYGLKKGMIGKNSVYYYTIGEVVIEETFAKGQLIDEGEITPFYFHFYKEPDVWKIDLTTIFSIRSAAFKTIQEESGKNENDYLFSLLEILTGRKPGNEIWKIIP